MVDVRGGDDGQRGWRERECLSVISNPTLISNALWLRKRAQNFLKSQFWSCPLPTTSTHPHQQSPPLRVNGHHHCASTATTLCVNGKPRDGAIHQVSFVFCIFVSTQCDNHQHQHLSPSASIGHIQYDPRPHATHPQAEP